MEWIYDRVESVGRELYLRALKDIPPDVRQAISKGLATEAHEGHRTAEQILFTILENTGEWKIRKNLDWNHHQHAHGPACAGPD